MAETKGAAGRWDYTLEEGARFVKTLLRLDDDDQPLAFEEGSKVRSQIRKRYADAEPILDLEEYMTLNEAAGRVTIDIPADASKGLDFGEKLSGVHDIEIVPPDGAGGFDETKAWRWLQGVVTYSREATK